MEPVELWKCANCGAAAEGTTKPCNCATGVGFRHTPTGGMEYIGFMPRRREPVISPEHATQAVALLRASRTEPSTGTLWWSQVRELLASIDAEQGGENP